MHRVLNWALGVLLLAAICTAQWLTVCDHDTKTCGCYANNTADYRQLSSFLSANGPAGDGYTILVSPYMESCEYSDCWTLKSNGTGELVTWRFPQLTIAYSDFTVRSAYTDQPFHVQQDEDTARAFNGDVGSGTCSAFRVTGDNVHFEGIAFRINETCESWSRTETEDVEDMSHIIYVRETMTSGSVTNVTSEGALSVVTLLPPDDKELMTITGAFTVMHVSGDETSSINAVIVEGSIVANSSSPVLAYKADVATSDTLVVNASYYIPMRILDRGEIRRVYTTSIVDHSKHLTVVIVLASVAIFLLLVVLIMQCVAACREKSKLAMAYTKGGLSAGLGAIRDNMDHIREDTKKTLEQSLRAHSSRSTKKDK